MTDTAKCPVCQGHLAFDGNLYRCDECEADYEAQAVCNTCGDPVAKRSEDYFCNHCVEVKGKDQVKYRYLVFNHELIS